MTVQNHPRNTLVIPAETRTYHPRFGRLPAWQVDLLQHLEVYSRRIHLVHFHGLTVVTDGGVKDGKGYFGVTIATGQIIIAKARGAARGDPTTMSSFRAEAYGFLAGISLLQCLLKQSKPPSH